ncbi:hypothetical protein WN944_014543 [Citrus x changshan-huyou]|uniref:Uncharacterized protein n=1 Tax=Citrus x changshan-huyou TaxID=2935761 RepID=A0AAP0QIT7_9ROSI
MSIPMIKPYRNFEKTDSAHMKASIMQMECYLQDITGYAEWNARKKTIMIICEKIYVKDYQEDDWQDDGEDDQQ